MPVSTRSQVSGSQDGPNVTNKARARIECHPEPEGAEIADPFLNNPHHGLKEKLKALTLLYEQQKNLPASERRFATHPSIDLLGSKRGAPEEDLTHRKSPMRVKTGELKERGTPISEKTQGIEERIKPLREKTRGLKERSEPMREKTQELEERSEPMRENMMPGYGVKPLIAGLSLEENRSHWLEAKENIDRFGFSCPKVQKELAMSSVAMKLSMGSGNQSEGKGSRFQKIESKELQTISETGGVGTRILVFVRLRPMAKREKEAGSRCCVRIHNKRDVYLTEFATENDYLRLKRLRGRHFTFDASFPDSTTQQEVYTTTTAELVEGVLQGRNGSVFCYGATGAGKTYTMLGTVNHPGVMVLAIKDLFFKIRQRSCDGNHVVHLSYLEVYNETVRDLLSPGRPLVLREDKQGIMASGLTQYRAYSTDEVMALLQQGNLNRTTEPTRANETSSRSHAILQVVAEYKVREGGNLLSRVGKLSLIDLAGSERALATDQRTVRSLEGANINRSLLALSSCINALVEGKKHIPYRNSKLTQLLKDSLGGACNTVMIANISPSNLSFGETQNTLHWADRAKEIRTKAYDVKDELLPVPESGNDQAKLLLELQKENRELRVQLARYHQKFLNVQAHSLAAAGSSPTPSISSPSSLLSPHFSSITNHPKERHRSKLSSIMPGSNQDEEGETTHILRQKVQSLENELERLKLEHELQLKHSMEIIRELTLNQKPPSPRKGHDDMSPSRMASLKCILSRQQQQTQQKRGEDDEGGARPRRMVSSSSKHVVTRTGLRAAACETTMKKKGGGGSDDLKSPSHRFVSPIPTAKKRSYWDITTANSPSVAVAHGRSTRSHVAAETPSMLLQLASPCFWFVLILGPHLVGYFLQPGFARQRPPINRNR
ncbi:hypothetical protein AMTRI_Chr04g179730 [Amborella trichopoda]